jgi:site-specific DNA-methyltransferase (cytosine-N4-specific)
MSFSDPKKSGKEKCDHKKSTNNSRPRAVFPCASCGKKITRVVCPKCAHPNEKSWRVYQEKIARLLERNATIGGQDYDDDTNPLIVVEGGSQDSREHHRKRSHATYNHYHTTRDRGIIPPTLPEGFHDPEIDLVIGEALESLRKLPDNCFHLCLTSPPYWLQRRYHGVPDHLDPGMSRRLRDYVKKLVKIFREVRRVLRPDGLFFLDIDDRLNTLASGRRRRKDATSKDQQQQFAEMQLLIEGDHALRSMFGTPEMLIWRMLNGGDVADRWLLRSRIAVKRSNPRPEDFDVDRPFRSWNTIYMFAKSPKYYYKHLESQGPMPIDIWQVPNGHHGCGDHPAAMTFTAADNCVKIGCRPGGTVFDPFCGSGTSGAAALSNGCHFWGCDLSEHYINDICHPRLVDRIRRPPIKPEKMAANPLDAVAVETAGAE